MTRSELIAILRAGRIRSDLMPSVHLVQAEIADMEALS